jgi:hypothetical protein
MAARSAGQLRSYATCYNPFVRQRRAGVWAGIMSALGRRAHDAPVQMIDTSIVRMHQRGACTTRNIRQCMGRSRGRLTSKVHAVVDTDCPIRDVKYLRTSSPDVRLSGEERSCLDGRSGRSLPHLLVAAVDVNAPLTLPCNAPRTK